MAKKAFQSIYSDDDHDEPAIELHPYAAPPILEEVVKEDRRAAPRFTLELEIIIFCAGMSFRSKTKNVSITGALMNDLLPSEFVNQVLDIVMIRQVGDNRDQFLFKGKSEGGPFRTPRISFTKVDELQKKRLEVLLESCPVWKS